MIGNYNIVHYDTIDSTQLEAKRLVKAYSDRGTQSTQNSSEIDKTVIIAKAQTNAYGQGNNKWDTVNDKNVGFTIILQFFNQEADNKSSNLGADHIGKLKLAYFPYITAVAIGEVIKDKYPHAVLSQKLQYKWVNDILLNGKKCGGILVEIVDGFVLIGIGINTDSAPTLGLQDRAHKIVGAVTSMKDEGIDMNSSFFIEEFLQKFRITYDECQKNGFETIRQTWKKNAAFLGDKIKILQQGLDKIYTGIFYDICEDGEMILQDATLEAQNGEEGRKKVLTKIYYGTIIK